MAKYGIYLIYQMALIALASKVLLYINDIIWIYFTWRIVLNFSMIISKILVTPVTMVLNFFVMRGVIEKM